MAMAPAFILVVYYFVDPDEHDACCSPRTFGQILLAIAVVLNVVAYLWARCDPEPGHLRR